MKRILPLLIIIILFAIPWQSSLAYVSGGVGKVALVPSTSQLPLNQNSSVEIIMNTANVPISTVAIRLSFPQTTADLSVISVTPNTSLAALGWFFQINSVNTDNGITTMDLVGLNTNLVGYRTASDVLLATITWKAIAPFSGRAVTFDTSLSKMIGKVNPTDILGTLGNGTYSAVASGGNPSPTPTHTPTPTPTPTRTPTPTPTPITGTNTVPTCTSLTANPPTSGSALSITAACYGIDPDGYLNAGYFEFGDGTNGTVERNAGSPGSFTTSHVYRQIGTYAITCRVRDNNTIWSPATESCKRYITFRSAETGTTVVVTSPTPQTTRITSPTLSPTATSRFTELPTLPPQEITPEPTFVYTPATPEKSSASPWLLVGALGLIGLGFIISLLGKRS